MFDLTNRYEFLTAAVLFEGSLIGIAAALGWWFEIDPLARLVWEYRGVTWGLAATVPMIGLFLVANRFPVGPLKAIKQFLHDSLGPSLVACRWYDLLLVAIVAGIGEELLFRGVFQPLMGKLWSNVIFGLLHFITAWYALLAALIGAYLGWLLDQSENVLAPIVTHGLYDFLAFLVVAREYRRSRRTLQE
jgi:membrane protease YdiL (CAAX protease family)